MFDGFSHKRVATTGAEINLRIGGSGPPLLLLHGYPETHVMWHKVAPALAKSFTVVCPDLRGYGASAKPPGGDDHAGYSKRAMAADQVEVMEKLGYRRFSIAGHDRGGRVAHRLCLDHVERVERAAVLDIVPTREVFETTDKALATAYFHWFFLIQRYDFPERLIGADPAYYLDRMLGAWGGKEGSIFAPEAKDAYLSAFRDPATIHATCEDYRAAASIDLVHDEADIDRKIEAPLLVLWGDKGVVHRLYDPLGVWRKRATDVRGKALPCGHFLPEEAPRETTEALLRFFSEGGGPTQ